MALLKALESFAGACLKPGYETAQVDVVKDKVYRDDHLAVYGRDDLFESLEPELEPTPVVTSTTGSSTSRMPRRKSTAE